MPPAKRKTTVNKVDETVVNQENPVISEKDRQEETTAKEENPVAEMAPAMEVDDTVKNQMNPGIDMVDRNPEPELVQDSAGITYDVSKPYPELVDPDAEARSQEKARIRQTEGALNAKDWREESDDADVVEIEFVESGLTADRHVWIKGEVLRVKEDEMSDWMKQSADEQKETYGRVFFERK